MNKTVTIDAETLRLLIIYAARTTQGTTDGQPILDAARQALEKGA